MADHAESCSPISGQPFIQMAINSFHLAGTGIRKAFLRLQQHGLAAQAAAIPQASFLDYVLRAPTTDVTTLDSGLRVVSKTATVGVWIDAGSLYEMARNNGAAHFLEHHGLQMNHEENSAASSWRWKLKKWVAICEYSSASCDIHSCSCHSSLIIWTRSLSLALNDRNAYTFREQTVYFAKVFKKDVGWALELLSA